MTDINKDKFIVEFFRECWHEPTIKSRQNFYGQICKKCRINTESIDDRIFEVAELNPDLTTPEGFFWLWEMMRTTLPAASILWREFLIWLDERDSMPAYFQVINLIDNRPKFRDTVYKFLQTQKGE